LGGRDAGRRRRVYLYIIIKRLCFSPTCFFSNLYLILNLYLIFSLFFFCPSLPNIWRSTYIYSRKQKF
jgi:hypothetical protein